MTDQSGVQAGLPGRPEAAPAAGGAAQAGAMLRAAREQAGLRLDVLAATIKVLPAKLEALEAGRIDELPDATFARALALAVCRAIKVDPAPVLAVMPGNRQSRLERVDEGLNTPFREHSGRWLDGQDWAPWQRPVPWLAALLLAAAAVFVLLPGRLPLSDEAAPPLPASAPADAPQAAAPAAADPASANGDAVPAGGLAASAAAATVTAASAATAGLAVPAAGAATPAAAAAGPAAADALIVAGLQSTWVQVVDADGHTLLSRVVGQGETAVVTGALPLKVRIGNAVGTELRFRGKPVDLAPASRNNLASLSLP